MKKILAILVLGLLLIQPSFSNEEQEKDLSDEEYYEKLSNDMSIGAIDFECLNMCKDSMTGMSISASRSFCINQCSMP